jgi:acetyl-CoA C-acetyltransferase
MTQANMTAPGGFAQLASGYAAKYKIRDEDLKRAMAHVSAKSHANGVLNPKAHRRSVVCWFKGLGCGSLCPEG